MGVFRLQSCRGPCPKLTCQLSRLVIFFTIELLGHHLGDVQLSSWQTNKNPDAETHRGFVLRYSVGRRTSVSVVSVTERVGHFVLRTIPADLTADSWKRKWESLPTSGAISQWHLQSSRVNLPVSVPTTD